jgi:hypothetical protein
MSWEIVLPVRSPADPFDPNDLSDDIATAISDPAERAVARNVVLHFVGQGETVGDVLDALEAASPAQRRALLDRARTDAGLRTIEREEQHRAFETANASAAPSQLRDSQGRVQALCGDPGCRNFEPGELPGSIKWVNVRRWWCGQHRHLAADGDLEPWRSTLRYGPTGAIESGAEIEAEGARQRAAAESRRKRYEQRQAERREDAARLAKYEAAADDRV